MDRDSVLGFVEENTMVADAQTKQALELAVQWLHATFAGVGVPVNTFQNVERGLLLDRSNLSLDVGTEANLLQTVSVHFADLIHCEAAGRHHVFKRQTAIRVLPEVLA